MKNFKKLMALVIAAVMVVGTLSMVGAATGTVYNPADSFVEGTTYYYLDSTDNTFKVLPITIDHPASFEDAVLTYGGLYVPTETEVKNRSISIGGLDADDTVNFYKILEWADSTNEASQHGTVSGWYWAEPFESAFDNNGDKGYQKLYDAVDATTMKLILTDELANDIARVINEEYLNTIGKSVTPVNASPIASANGVATHTFENVAADDTTQDGLYMAVITPADQDVVYNPVFVHLDSNTDADQFNVVMSSASYMDAPEAGAAKKSKVTVEKEAHNANDYTDTLDHDTDPVDDGDTTKPGDVLTFTVKTTIPGYGDTFDHPKFNITDKMNGLKLLYAESGEDAGTITVKVSGSEVAASADTYTLTPSDGQYTIVFAESYLKTKHVPAAVEVTYTAKVLDAANVNVVKEKNTVELEFSHDPTTENESTPGGEKVYKKDITNHYTFAIDANALAGPDGTPIAESGSEIIKVGVDKDGNPINSTVWTYSNVELPDLVGQQSPLAGAEFTLFGAKWNAAGTELEIDTTKSFGTATSDAAGRINFEDLDAGTYFLLETKAPAGFVKNSDPVAIKIEATLAEKEITEWYDQAGNWYATKELAEAGAASLENTKVASYTYKTDELKSYKVTYGNKASEYTFDHIHESNNDEIKWNIVTSEEAPQSIPNVKGVELPSTGGMGTTMFYAIGAILVLGAGILLVSKRRMAAN